MKQEEKNLTDQWLEAIGPVAEAETDPFFYTRLRARMEKNTGPSLPVKPGWVIAVFSLLLLINGITLFYQQKNLPVKNDPVTNPVQSVADSYDIRISSTNY